MNTQTQTQTQTSTQTPTSTQPYSHPGWKLPPHIFHVGDPFEEIRVNIERGAKKYPALASRLEAAGWLLENGFLMLPRRFDGSVAVCHSQHKNRIYNLTGILGDVPKCSCQDVARAPFGPGQRRCCKHILAYCLAVRINAKLPADTPEYRARLAEFLDTLRAMPGKAKASAMNAMARLNGV